VQVDDELIVRGNGAVQVVGGALLASGTLPRLAALTLAGSMIPTTVAGHASTTRPSASCSGSSFTRTWPSSAACCSRSSTEIERLPQQTARRPVWVTSSAGCCRRLPPLAQRLATDLATDPRFDSPRAVQLRLPGFDLPGLGELGRIVCELYAGQALHPERIAATVDDAYVDELARALEGELGGRVGIVPRLFLRKLVQDVLDRVDEHADFDPRRALPAHPGPHRAHRRRTQRCGTGVRR
jgi:P-loop Domain of unknown function (DUF2791)/DoxX